MIKLKRGILKDGLIQVLSTIGSQFAIITDDIVAPLYGEKMARDLNAHLFSFPNGEQHKTRQTKEMIEDQMFEKGLGRDTCVIALGGGVVTDVGGFVAATYCRGLSLVMIPTTLLGMVDASMGGKTAINVPYGKNMIGSIYQPRSILIDPEVLETLPQREIKNGVVEMIKHGIIFDPAYFEYLEVHMAELFALDPKVTEWAILESCRIKMKIVEQDVKDHGVRHLLNCGHTVAHALESLTQYSIAHGEAVALGLLVESHFALQMGLLKPASFERIEQILKRYALPLKAPGNFSFEALLAAMTIDKKSLKGRPRFVLLQEIGEPFDCTHVEEEVIKNGWQYLCGR